MENRRNTLFACMAILVSIVATPRFVIAEDAAQSQASRQVAEFVKRFSDLFNGGDASGVAALFADDAINMSPGGITRGRAAIEAEYRKAIGIFTGGGGANNLVISPSIVRPDGNYILAVGTYTLRVNAADVKYYFCTTLAQQGTQLVIIQNMRAPAR